MFVNKGGKILAVLCNWMPFTWLQFLLLSLNMLFFWQVAILLSLQLAAEIQEDFLIYFFVFNSECRGEKSVPFTSTESIYNSPRRHFEYRFFSLLSKGDLQVDVFSLWVWAQPEAALHTSPELCQGKLVQWPWGQFKAISFSIMWNLTFLVLSDSALCGTWHF